MAKMEIENKVASERKAVSPVEQKQFDALVEQLIVCLNDFHKAKKFESGETRVSNEKRESLFEKAGTINKDFEDNIKLLIGYLESWGERKFEERSFQKYREFLAEINPYFSKYGYYFNIDITKSYPKPTFICRFKSSEEEKITNSRREEKIFNVVRVERVTNDYYWTPDSSAYLLPATDEIIIFEDLLLKEANDLARDIKSVEESIKEGVNLHPSWLFIHKQWENIKDLPDDEIIKIVKNDLTRSKKIGATREAIDVLFLDKDQDNYENYSSEKLAGLALGPIPFYCLGLMSTDLLG